jgi:gas vesicle protein
MAMMTNQLGKGSPMMKSDKTPTSPVVKALGAAMAGVTLGYVVGSLTAPASGTETRTRIRKTVDHHAQEISKTARDATRKAESALNDTKSRLIGAKDRFVERIHS